MPRRNVVAALVILAALVGGSACKGGGTPSPTEPTPPQTVTADITGTWSGSGSDSSGPGEMTWRLTQTGNAVSGTLMLHDADTSVSGQGSISGTVSGSTLSFSITIPIGGFDAPFVTCTSSVSGSANISASVITATYSGSNSCTGSISSGQLSLSKQ